MTDREKLKRQYRELTDAATNPRSSEAEKLDAVRDRRKIRDELKRTKDDRHIR